MVESEPVEIEQIVGAIIQRLALQYYAGGPTVSEMRPSDRDALLRHNIQADIRLASRAAELMLLALLALRSTHAAMFDKSATEEDRRAAYEESFRFALDLELHIRSLYELLYAIRDLTRSPSHSEPRLGAELVDELDRLAQFRGLLVVHKEGVARPLRSMSGGRYDLLDVRIGGSLVAIAESDASQLQAIFKRNSAHLPDDLRTEGNANQQLQILYENLGRVNRSDLGDIKALIGRNGVSSDSPVVLARVVLALVKTYIPSRVP